MDNVQSIGGKINSRRTVTSTGKNIQAIENVVKMQALRDCMPQLLELYEQKRDTAGAYAEVVKAVAETSGLLSSTITKYVSARANDKTEAVRQQANQLSLIFEEMAGA